MQSSGTLKIFDGLFIGDQNSARDEQFLLLNHVTTVLNLTLTCIPNYYQHYDLQYLNLDWPHLSQHPHQLPDLCTEIDTAHLEGQSVLIHGLQNLDQPAALTAVYIMHRFRWSLYKTLQYLQSRINRLTFTPSSFQLLKTVQLQLLQDQARLTYNWNAKPLDYQQLVLRNTYLNSNQGDNNKFTPRNEDQSLKKNKAMKGRISWKMPTQQNERRLDSSSGKSRVNIHQSQNGLKNKIILSVRKILTDSSQKDVTNIKKNRGLNIKQNSNNIRNIQPQLSLKKYKSSYSLASLSSFQNAQSLPTHLPSINSINSLQYTQKQNYQNTTNQRVSTQRSESYRQSPLMINKQIVKTQGEDIPTKAIIQIHLPRRNSQRFRSCKSLQLQSQKQNIQKTNATRIPSKLSLRKPTPQKPPNLLLRK